MNLFLNILITIFCMPWPAIIMMSPMMIATPGFANKTSSMLMAMAFFTYPAFLFILLYLIGYSFYGTNPLWWAASTCSVGILISIIYRLPPQIYHVLVEISNYGYFTKNNSVYFNGKRIKGMDAHTAIFYNDLDYYCKDKNHVFYNAKILKHADAATFQPLANDKTESYWHDKNYAYYKWKRIDGADGASIIYAGQNYAYDKDNVFYQNELMQNADRATFQVLHTDIGRDKENVFVRSMRTSNIKDNASFEIISIQDQIFGKDKYQIYTLRYSPPHPLVPFPNADIETFEVVGEYYAKDKNRVYYYHYHVDNILVLEGANPQNFKLHFDPIKRTDATDGERYYESGVLHLSQCQDVDRVLQL